MQDVFFGLLMPRALSADADVADWVRLLCKYPSLVPVKYDGADPLRERFDPDNLRRLHEVAGFGQVIWRTADKSLGFLGLKNGPGVLTSFVTIQSAANETVAAEFTGFMRDMSARFGAVCGYVHLLTPLDIATGLSSGAILDKSISGEYLLLMDRRRLVRYIPDLYWANVLGPAYTQIFGRDRMLSAPAHLVRELAPDTFYLQLTDRLSDLKDRFNQFDSVRRRVKEHLGADAFFSPELGREHTYRTPDFPWRALTPSQQAMQKLAEEAMKRGRGRVG